MIARLLIASLLLATVAHALSEQIRPDTCCSAPGIACTDSRKMLGNWCPREVKEFARCFNYVSISGAAADCFIYTLTPTPTRTPTITTTPTPAPKHKGPK